KKYGTGGTAASPSPPSAPTAPRWSRGPSPPPPPPPLVPGYASSSLAPPGRHEPCPGGRPACSLARPCSGHGLKGERGEAFVHPGRSCLDVLHNDADGLA